MEHSLRKIDKNKHELTVELNKEELAGYIKSTEERIAGELEIKGFRKGKAPKNLIREKISNQQILETALEQAVQSSMARVIDTLDLEVTDSESETYTIIRTLSMNRFNKIIKRLK